MIATCSKCGQKNRIPNTPKKVRCGRCKLEFSIADLAKAKSEPPPEFELDIEDDIDFYMVNRVADRMPERLIRACWPKERHDTQRKAEAQLRSIQRRGLEKNAATIHTYQCPSCAGWHVGHGR